MNIWIAELLQGSIEADDMSVFLRTPSRSLARRLCIVGTVLANYGSKGERRGKYRHLRLDDGTGVVLVKAWGSDVDLLTRFVKGDVACIVGRPRSDDSGKFIKADSASKIDDFKQEMIHRLDILRVAKIENRPVLASVFLAEENTRTAQLKISMLEFLHNDESTQGIGLQAIKEAFAQESDEVESVLIELMQEGTVYEPRKTFYRAV